MRWACVALAFALLALLSAGESRGADPSAVHRVAVTGQAVPGGGTFDRFSVESLPIVAPINGKGQVAFFATVLRGRANEGFFLSSGARITKLAADGDPAPGGGVFSGFGRHPVPAPAGGAAPDIPSGTLASVDAPAINDRGDVAFLATVRRGRESLEAIYLHSGGKSRKVVAQGDPAPAGGTFAGFGPPSLNGKGLVVFGGVVEGRTVPGGLFVSKGGTIRMLVGAGDETPDGG